MRGADTRAWLGKWTPDFALVTVLGALIGLLGPFGSYLNGPAWQRIVYWTAMGWLGLPVYAAAGYWFGPRRTPRRTAWIALGGMAVVFSFASAWVSWMIAHALWPRLNHVPGLTPLVWYSEGLTISAVFALLFWRRWRVDAHRAAEPPAAAPGLLGAEPSQVLCLQMEDHYVRVHTAGGSRLVLATFSQAIEALGRAPGLRVHRSWWVAERAVAGAVADGRNLRIRLVNDLTAPVSRSSVAAVREAGWLGRGEGAGET